ncbi:hypothetical protein LRR18_17205, partial [Mangrovimonas sp. AS39]|uniref:hypothetical protein n=1 Tax=Mangrovimonas futianensis TaxID=2895523 RepID=UPI001E453143
MKKQPIVQTTVETDSLIDSILEETAKRSEEKKPVKKTVKNRAKKVVVKLAQHPNLKDKEFITLPAKERIIHVLAAALKHNSNVQYYKSNYGNSHLYEENKKYIPTV